MRNNSPFLKSSGNCFPYIVYTGPTERNSSKFIFKQSTCQLNYMSSDWVLQYLIDIVSLAQLRYWNKHCDLLVKDKVTVLKVWKYILVNSIIKQVKPPFVVRMKQYLQHTCYSFIDCLSIERFLQVSSFKPLHRNQRRTWVTLAASLSTNHL